MDITRGVNKMDPELLALYKPETKYANVPWDPEYMVYTPYEVKATTLEIITQEMINRKLIHETLFSF
jgi:hypothetical protein